MNIFYNLSDPDVEKFLTKWFSGGQHQFGQFRNYIHFDLDGYKKFIIKCLTEREPAFHSVQSKAKIEKLFWEFDIKAEIKNVNYFSPELNIAWDQAIKLALKIISLGAKPLIIYSGRRGFHVWVYTPKLGFNEENEAYGRRLYKRIIFDILESEAEFPDLDKTPMHVNALARIPFSFHQKTLNQVVPLTIKRKPYVPNLDDFINSKLPDEYIMNEISDLSHDVGQINGKDFKSSKIKDWNIRPCVIDAFISEKSHNSNLAFLLDSLYAGKTNEELHIIFKNTGENYDYEKTEYQINYARNKIKDGLKPASKATLKEWGICNDCGLCGPPRYDKFIESFKYDGNTSNNIK